MASAASSVDPRFEALLAQLMNNDNATRRAAETQYFGFRDSNAAALMLQLVAVLRTSAAMKLRLMAGVLLRGLADVTLGVWAKGSGLTPESREQIKNQLIASFQAESNAAVARKTAYVIAQLAAEEMPRWPQVLSVVEAACCDGSNDNRRELGFMLLALLCEFASTHLTGQVAALQTLMGKGVGDARIEVRASAAKAVKELLVDLPANLQKPFTGLMPHVLGLVEAAVTADELRMAEDALRHLVDIARRAPVVFKASYEAVAGGMMKLAANEAIDVDVRKLATEFVLTLCESGGKSVRESSTLVNSMVQLVLTLCTQVEEDSAWATKSYKPRDINDTEGDEDSIARVGQDGVFRLSVALSGSMLDLASPLVGTLLKPGATWQQKRAGVLAIGLMAEGVSNAMRSKLKNVVGMVVPFAADPHPRVRYAALSAITLLTVAFKKKALFMKQNHAVIVPALAESMTAASKSPLRVRAHAASALASFCVPDPDEANAPRAPPKSVVPYLKQVVAGIVDLLGDKSCDVTIRQLGVNALAQVAAVTGDAFSAHYDSFMPGLRGVVASTTGLDYDSQSLRGRALLCMTEIGAAAGAAKFSKDAMEVFDAVLRDEKHIPRGSVFESMLIEASVKMCKTLGAACLPFLKVMVPRLVADSKTEMKLHVSADDVTSGQPSDDGMIHRVVEVRGVGMRTFSMNTHQAQQKAQAVETLFEFADVLEGLFIPYIPQVVEAVAPLCSFKLVSTLRESACLTLSRCLYGMAHGLQDQGADMTNAVKLFNCVVATIQAALDAEFVLTAKVVMAECLRDALVILRDVGVAPGEEAIVKLVSSFMGHVEASYGRRVELMQKMQASEDTTVHNQICEDLEMHAEFSAALIDGVGNMAQLFGDKVLPLFHKEVFPKLQPYLRGNIVLGSVRVNAFGPFIDAVEFCGAEGKKVLPVLLPALKDGMTHEDPEVRQSAFYGVQVVAKHAPETLAAEAGPLATALMKIIKTASRIDDPDALAVENAVSALSAMCRHVEAGFDATKALEAWLRALPLTADQTEALEQHKLLCEYVHAADPRVLGNGCRNVPHIVNVMATVMVGADGGGDEDQLADEETLAAMPVLIMGLMNSKKTPRPIANAAWASLNEAQQAVVSAAVAAVQKGAGGAGGAGGGAGAKA